MYFDKRSANCQTSGNVQAKNAGEMNGLILVTVDKM